jgi:hypothetical protein
VDSLQLGDKHRITTPVNWKKGDDIIVHPGVSDDEAKKLFPEFRKHLVGFRADAVHLQRSDASLSVCVLLQPYLRTAPSPF